MLRTFRAEGTLHAIKNENSRVLLLKAWPY
jgi:hypothetical protein